jgi:PPOX class probable F420-dependent enzyme
VATVNKDGSPQVSAVWIGLDGDLITFNTAEGRVKTSNVHRDERVAVSIHDQANPYENLIVQGKVVEITHDGADADIDALAKRYLDADSYPFRQPGEERVIVKIEPQKVNHTNP